MKPKEKRIEDILKVMWENPLYPLKLPHYFNDCAEADWGYELGWKEAIKEFRNQYKRENNI